MDKLIFPSINHFHPVAYVAPIALKDWINCQTSITEQLLNKACDARLQVVRQVWSAPNIWDKNVLKLQNTSIFRRDILMWAHDDICWYARTLIPTATYKVQDDFFNRLRYEPLGALLFHNSEVTRVYRVDYPIDSLSLEYHWVRQAMGGRFLSDNYPMLWARLSIYLRKAAPFYLVEVFLPSLERYV